MNHFITKIVLAMLAAVLLSSCSTASIKQTWRDPESPAAIHSKLLVVGIANDDNVRRMFENIFVETLQDHGVAAVQSHTLLGELHKDDAPLLQAAARKVGADAVIITRALSRSERTNYQYATGEVQYRTMVMEETGPDHSITVAMGAVGIAPNETDFEKATLLTNFFDAASARLLWSARSSISESGDRPKACWDLSALLVEALRRDRMIGGH